MVFLSALDSNPWELVFNQRGVTLASVGQAVLLRLLESPEHHAAAVQVGEGGRKVTQLGRKVPPVPTGK